LPSDLHRSLEDVWKLIALRPELLQQRCHGADYHASKSDRRRLRHLRQAQETMNRIAKYAAGIAILKEWLGKKGIPVKSDLAESRAQTCLKCRLNAKKTLWDQLSYHVAKRILQHVRSRITWAETVRKGIGHLRVFVICH
jgi:hypothetical protein